MAVVHGFRRFSIVRCSKTQELVFRGQMGMHVHSNPAPSAVCRNPGSVGMWMTPAAVARNAALTREEREHPEYETPRFDCSCGFYGYRTYNAASADSWGGFRDFLAHVTCMGEVVLHEEGFRTKRYQIDYILRPPSMEEELSIWTLADSPGYYTPSERLPVGQALAQVLDKLAVPMWEKEDPRGCAICQSVNGWHKPEDVVEKVG